MPTVEDALLGGSPLHGSDHFTAFMLRRSGVTGDKQMPSKVAAFRADDRRSKPREPKRDPLSFPVLYQARHKVFQPGWIGGFS